VAVRVPMFVPIVLGHVSGPGGASACP
jgi:hypothetical protein